MKTKMLEDLVEEVEMSEHVVKVGDYYAHRINPDGFVIGVIYEREEDSELCKAAVFVSSERAVSKGYDAISIHDTSVDDFTTMCADIRTEKLDPRNMLKEIEPMMKRHSGKMLADLTRTQVSDLTSPFGDSNFGLEFELEEYLAHVRAFNTIIDAERRQFGH